MINNNATVSINLEQITKSLENLLKEIVSNTFHFCSQTGITLQHCQELLEPEDEDFFHSAEASPPRLVDEFYDTVFYYLTLHQIQISYSKLKKASNERLSILEESLFTQEERQNVCAIPLKPYYIELAKVVYIWISRRELPITFQRMEGLNEVVDDTERLKKLTPELLEWAEEFQRSSFEQQKYLWSNLLEKLGIRGILTLFRIRKTEGSVDMFPPSSFNKLHDEKSKLTVGARALSKHAKRSSEKFWGIDKGSSRKKNQHAEKILRKLLREATWINIHRLPHDIITYEVRIASGYGIRWRLPDVSFRGFLEPQMEDGHEKGWIH